MPALSPAKTLFLLVHDVARLLRRTVDQRAQTIGLTSAQWRILSAVARAELLNHEPLNQATLAEQMDLEPITLSRHVDRMQAAGMIERRPNPGDRRAYFLYVTEESKPLLRSFGALSADCIAGALAGVSEEEVRLVTDVLSRMKNNIVGKPGSGNDTAPSAQQERVA